MFGMSLEGAMSILMIVSLITILAALLINCLHEDLHDEDQD